MDGLLSHGVENLSDLLREYWNTRAAFKLIVEVIEEIVEFFIEDNKGFTKSLISKKRRNENLIVSDRQLGDVLSSSYKSKMDELREIFKKESKERLE